MKPHLIPVEGMVKLVAELGYGMSYTTYIRNALQRRGNPHSVAAVRKVLADAERAGYIAKSAMPRGCYGHRWTPTDAGRAIIGAGA